MTKEEVYVSLLPEVASLLEGERDIIASMANLSSLLHGAFGFWWTGFYRVSGEELVLGPFQGPLACTRIPFGKGVCGSAWKAGETIVVPDVDEFPGHIACSSESRSEIVVPVRKAGEIIAVLDIDSTEPGCFDDTDRKYLEMIVRNFSGACIRDIYFAGGCFWGAEKYLKLLRGVVETEVGYANGNTQNPTYRQVYTDTTGYAECVHVRYDPQVISLGTLTGLFFKAIDPTSVNRQGEDSGTRYRTGVYYLHPEDAAVLEPVFEEQSRACGRLAVELLPLRNFVRAEEYHQDYLDKNPDGYCHLSPDLFEFARSQGK